jgi:succinate dehydrogenase / fumarate reductase, iron-sulfur subunit
MIDKISPDRKTILANIRIQRFTPGRDKSPYFDNFKINVETGMTVLEALRLIKNTQDESLTFRSFCRSKICGSCSVRINNKPVLACSTQLLPILEDFKQESVVIQPLRNMPLLRDLVVDLDPVIEKLAKMHPYIMENKDRIPETLESESLMSRKELKRFDYVTDCILCSSCYSACSAVSADGNYAGPLTLGKAYRFSADGRDDFKGERMQAAVDQGLWSCAQCRKCINVCPKDTRPAISIQRLRKLSIDDGIHDTKGSRRAKAYTDDVAVYGQVNKPMLPVVVNGPKGWAAVEMADNFLKKHGIEPERQVCHLPGQNSTQKIYATVKKLEAEGENKT